MDNAKQIRRINNALDNLSAKPTCPSCNHTQVEDVLKAVRTAHEEELMPKAEPKPLKLEAGCRVRAIGAVACPGKESVVVLIHESMVWCWDDVINSRFHKDNVEVIEAATPGVNDYVQMAGGHDCGVIIGWGNSCGYYSIYLLTDRRSADFARQGFTILYKAPKE